MPDFTEILKIAVQQQDWQLICGLYTNITGEPLSLPTQNDEPEPKEEDILEKDFDVEDLKKEKSVDTSTQSRYNDFTAPSRNYESRGDSTGRQSRPEPIGQRQLKNVVGVSEEPFVDDMTEALFDPDTGEPLTGLENKKVTPRNKRKELGMNDTSLINAVCSSCKRESRVSSVLLYGYSTIDSENTWVCNDCSTRKGRRGRNND
tara:strand:+ start:7155 stop:7766 length:612 start_codon:yes stop_codon:yes gene_type:complete